MIWQLTGDVYCTTAEKHKGMSGWKKGET